MSKKNEEIMEVTENQVTENQVTDNQGEAEETKKSIFGRAWDAIREHKVAVGVTLAVGALVGLVVKSRDSEEEDSVVADYDREGYHSFTVNDVNDVNESE